MHRDHRGAGACGATSGAEPKKAGEARRPKLVPTSLGACGAIFRTSSVLGGLGGRVVGCAGEVRRWSWNLPVGGLKSHGAQARSQFQGRNGTAPTGEAVSRKEPFLRPYDDFLGIPKDS